MMKHSIIALLGIAAMGLAACDEFTMPNPPAQSNEPEGPFETSDLVVNNTVSGTISLPDLRDSGSRLNIANVTVSNVPEGYSVKFTGELSATEDFENAAEFSTVLNSETGVLSAGVADLQTAYNTVVSKDLVEKTVYIRYAAYLVSGSNSVRVGGPETFYCDKAYQVLPLPQENVIETSYYLAGSFCDWNMTEAIEFTHVTEGNVYDNPIFSVKIDVTPEQAAADGGFRWKVVPVSCHTTGEWAGTFGAEPEKDGASKGKLVASTSAQEYAGVIADEGPYMITIDMEARTYTVDKAFENLWVVGAGSSVSDFKKILKLYSTDYVSYTGTMRLKTSFYFTGQASLSGVRFKMSSLDDWSDEEGVLSGTMATGGNVNMKVTTEGLYFIKANVVSLEWSAVMIPSIQLIGTVNGWDTETAQELTANSTFNVWTIENVEMPVGEYKFCVDHAWKYSFGGEIDDIVQNGGNLSIDEAGTYSFTLHFDASPAYLEVTKK